MCAAALTSTFLLTATAAKAQAWPERVYVSVNGAFQATSNDFSDRFEFEKDLETGSTATDYRVRSGVLFDGGGGWRMWKNLGVGVAVSVFSRQDSGATITRSPHPFFFGQPREASGVADGLARSETAVHVQAMYLLATSGALRAAISGGPTFFTVKQDLVTEAVLTDAFPYDTASFSTARKQTARGSASSFNVGVDVLWMLRGGFGVGGVVRVSRASVDLDAPANRAVQVDAGGIYAGGGVRLLF